MNHIVSIEIANICHILPKPLISNGLLVTKLKQDLKYRGHAYFEPVQTHITYQVLSYLKSLNEFNKDISIANSMSDEDMFRISNIVKIQRQNENVTQKYLCLIEKKWM